MARHLGKDILQRAIENDFFQRKGAKYAKKEFRHLLTAEAQRFFYVGFSCE